MDNKYLILCVGVSNSGKSTFALEYIQKHWSFRYLNADLMRIVITGDIANQDANYKIFDTLERMCAYFMILGQNILIDNTNVSPQQRKTWVKLARLHGYKIIAYCFKTPLSECLMRNSLRERKVPIEVIEKQYNNLSWPDLTEVDQIEEII